MHLSIKSCFIVSAIGLGLCACDAADATDIDQTIKANLCETEVIEIQNKIDKGQYREARTSLKAAQKVYECSSETFQALEATLESHAPTMFENQRP